MHENVVFLIFIQFLDAIWLCLRENCMIDEATGYEKVPCKRRSHLFSYIVRSNYLSLNLCR